MTDQYIYGLHAVHAALSNRHRKVLKLFISQERDDKRLQDILTKATHANIAIERKSPQAMNQSFADFSHQGVVALASCLPEYGERDLARLIEQSKAPCLILILDGVTDPHNLGACLRSADAAGVDFVMIPKDNSANITPVVSKVACGAAESMPLVRVTNLARAMSLLKEQGIWIYGACGEATQEIYDFDYQTSVALVMGAEGSGMRRLTREHCDGLFSLPMCGSVSSLNVSVATGISLYEVVRQRKNK